MSSDVAQTSSRAADHGTRYEALRAHVVERRTRASRDGLIVLLREGVVAWIDAWSRLPAAPARLAQAESQRPPPLFNDASAEVVRVLAAMTLGHIEEVHV